MYYFQCYFFINFLILTLFFFPFTQKMFIQSRANISCGVCRKLTRIEPGKSVDESLESDLNCLDLTTGFQELHSDLVSTQDQLRVARKERADFLQKRNAVIDQQNQIEDACQKDKENEAVKIFKNSRQSRKAGYKNCADVDVPSSSSDDSDHEKAPPKKAKTNVPLKLEPTKHSSPFSSPKAELQFRI